MFPLPGFPAPTHNWITGDKQKQKQVFLESMWQEKDENMQADFGKESRLEQYIVSHILFIYMWTMKSVLLLVLFS